MKRVTVPNLITLLTSILMCAGLLHAAPIPETEISALQKQITEISTETSITKKRRACKSIIRKGNSLINTNPTAPNRYHVLAIVFQTKKRLLTLDNDERNRSSLYETCAIIAKAPDKYAKLRLEADLILMERDMSAKNADVKERAKVLEALVDRYRNTPAEAKSLMIAATIAPKLDAFELEQKFTQLMDERFGGDMDVIEWRRTHRDYGHFKLIYKGTFTRIDGTQLTFPIDGIGHTCVMFFWSEKSPDFQARLLEIKNLQSRRPEAFKVFSFNVDQLPDGGAGILKRHGMECTVMRLPGGKNSQIYRVYAGKDPIAVRINPHGHSLLPSSVVRTKVEEMPMEQNLDEIRYVSQLQSLLIGDFLVSGSALSKQSKSIPAETITTIQNCIPPAPTRYRLTRTEAITKYQQAERLSREAIQQHADAPDVWRLRNLHIISLLGRWSLETEPKHLLAAVAEAKTTLDTKPPEEARIVPQFCLAINALRQTDANSDNILESFVQAAGKNNTTNAAACILAMFANAREFHQHHRKQLLAQKPTDPSLWPVVSFLHDQNHRIRLFQANFYLPPSRARRAMRGALRLNAADLDSLGEKDQLLKAEFKTLNGDKLSFPQATKDKLTLIMFIEPPADPNTDFPTEIIGSVTIDDNGRKRETRGVMQHALEMAEQDPSKSIQVIAAFLSDDKTKVQALMKKYAWPCQAVMVPGGLKNPLVKKFGILSADKAANIFLIRPDGTLVWSISGLVHPQQRAEGIGEYTGSIKRAIKRNIQQHAMAQSLDTLKQGKHKDAVLSFSGPFPTDRRDQDSWLPPQLHGRALAYIGLKDWKNALADIDAAILAHDRIYSGKEQCKCTRTAKLLHIKTMLLEKLGQNDEAQKAQQRAAASALTHTESQYETYHSQLDAIEPKER